VTRFSSKWRFGLSVDAAGIAGPKLLPTGVC